jgi:hypothetical protein
MMMMMFDDNTAKKPFNGPESNVSWCGACICHRAHVHLTTQSKELQSGDTAARQSGLLGSGAISGVAGFARGQMQAGIDERVNMTADRTVPSFDGSELKFKTPERGLIVVEK